ncbi:MAG TPA: AsmA family protein [Rhodocyclaceae bacterium]|nr:AsmA family protein [Rhodocyclaceae bacterium]
MGFKPLKLLAFLLGGLSAVMGAGALYLYATFDGARLAAELTQSLRQQTQRTVRLDGPVALSLFPRLSLRLPATTVSDPRSDGAFLAFERAELRVGLWPLLSRRVAIEAVELQGPQLTLRRRRDGAVNTDDLAALLQGQEGDTALPLTADVHRLVVHDGRVDWLDEADGRRLGVTGLTLETDDLASQSVGRLSLTGHLRGDSPNVEVDLRVASDYRLDAVGGRHALRHLSLSAVGVLAGRGDLEARASLDELAWVTGGELVVKGAAGDLRARAAEGAPVLHLATPDLRLTANGPVAATVDADARWGSEAEGGRLTARLSDLQARAAGISVTADLRTGDDRLNLQGRGAGDWRAAESLAQLRGVVLEGTWTRRGGASSPVRAGADLQVDTARGSAGGTVDLRIDGSRINGTWALSRFAPWAGRFELEADRLDADRLFAATGDRWDLSGLHGFDVDGQLRIGSLRAAGLQFERVRLPLSLHGGRLVSRGHAAGLYGGAVAGNFTLVADGNKAFYTGQINGVSVGPLLRDATGREALSGTLNAFVDVATAAGRRSALAGALAGKGRFVLGHGAVRGIDPFAALREWQAAIAARRGARRTFRDAEQAGLTEWSGSFGIERGVVSSADLQARSAQWRASGHGVLDLAAGRIDVQQRLTVLALPPGAEGIALASLRGATLPVRVTGPLGRAEWLLEPSSGVQSAPPGGPGAGRGPADGGRR